MSNSAQSDMEIQISELLNKAKVEECKYNWNEEIELLKKAEIISSNEKLKKNNSAINYKLGEIYQTAANFEKTEENVLKCLQLSRKHFEKANKLFVEQKNESYQNASLGFINYLNYIIEPEENRREDFTKIAKNYFKKAKLISAIFRNPLEKQWILSRTERILTKIMFLGRPITSETKAIEKEKGPQHNHLEGQQCL